MELVAHAAARARAISTRRRGVPSRDRRSAPPLEHAPVNVASLLPLGDVLETELGRSSSIDFGLEISDVGRVRVHVFRPRRAAGLDPAVAAERPSLAALSLPVRSRPRRASTRSRRRLRRRGLRQVDDARGARAGGAEAPLESCSSRSRSDRVRLDRARELARSPTPGRPGRAGLRERLRDALREDPTSSSSARCAIRRRSASRSPGGDRAPRAHVAPQPFAASAIERVVDVYPPERSSQVRAQLADSLRAVISSGSCPRPRRRAHPRARGDADEPAVGALIRRASSRSSRPPSRRAGKKGCSFSSAASPTASRPARSGSRTPVRRRTIRARSRSSPRK